MIAQDTACLRTGTSLSSHPVHAAQELHEALFLPDAALTLFFCSPNYPLAELSDALTASFAGVPLMGCTTAGEIGPLGYLTESVTGVSLGAADFQVAVARIDGIDDSPMSKAEYLAQTTLADLQSRGIVPTGNNTFGLILIDRLSNQEEVIANALFGHLGGIQLFGGSAADGTRFEQTFVFHEGEFRNRSAVFILIHTERPFWLFKTEHFVATDDKMVVTEADASRRLVSEINGDLAASEYACIMGVEQDNRVPTVFATHPVVVREGGSNYVRSVMNVNQDESITFACAIDEGIVLSLAKPVDLIENLEHLFAGIRGRIGEPALVLGCGCLFRAIEMEQNGIKDQVAQIYAANNFIGFSTYGEQFNAMHVNQTLTGVAIGHAP